MESQPITIHSQEEETLKIGGKNDTNDTSMDSSVSYDDAKSSQSKDSDEKKGQLPTFTNEVVVIRPEMFYENEDCQTDNKFMKASGLKRQSTNDLVSYFILKMARNLTFVLIRLRWNSTISRPRLKALALRS